jgi:hypothetical protein
MDDCSGTEPLSAKLMNFDVLINEHLPLTAESSVVQFAIQKFEDQDIQNYNFARCSVWV